MTSPIFQQIATGLESLDLDENAKEVFREFVRGVRVAHGDIGGIDRQERHVFAASMLANQVPRSEIRDRLMARFQISRSHAYRVIDDALNV